MADFLTLEVNTIPVRAHQIFDRSQEMMVRSRRAGCGCLRVLRSAFPGQEIPRDGQQQQQEDSQGKPVNPI
jgi:hypothetical protein